MSENTAKPVETTSVRVIRPGEEPFDLVVTCEPVGELFAVTPALDLDHGLTGFWTVTHRPTGRIASGDSHARGCIGCARRAAQIFADSAADIDWGRERESLRVDRAARAVANEADEVLGRCFSLREC